MVTQQLVQPAKESPIEGIFRNVIGRKMTSQEKVLLQLKGSPKPPPRNAPNEKVLRNSRLRN